MKTSGSGEKDKNYRGLLVKTCSSESEKKCNKNANTISVLSYCSKIKRPGYLLG